MADTLPNGKCINLPNSIVNCDMTSVHFRRGKFSYGACVGDYWDTISLKQFHENFFRWFHFTIQNRVCSSVERAYHRRGWEGQVIFFTEMNTEVLVF